MESIIRRYTLHALRRFAGRRLFALVAVLVSAVIPCGALHADVGCPGGVQRGFGQPSIVTDFSIHSIHEHPNEALRNHMLTVVNGRVNFIHELTYFRPWLDGSYLVGPAAGLNALAYNDVSKMFYRQPSEKLRDASQNEYAFYHTADPASAVAFDTAVGIELHWRADYRFGELENPGQRYGDVPIGTYRIYRAVGAPTGFVFLDAVSNPGATAFSYVDGTVGDGLEYWYKIMSRGTYAEPTLEMEYSGHDGDATSYVNAEHHSSGPFSNAFWVENIVYTLLSGTGEKRPYTVEATLGAFIPQGAPPALEAKVKDPDENYTYSDYNSFPLSSQQTSPYHFRYTGVSPTPPAPPYAPWERNPGFWNGCSCRFAVIGGSDVFPTDQHFVSKPNNRISGMAWNDYHASPQSPEWRVVWKAETDRLITYFPSREYDGIYGDNAGKGALWDANVLPYGFNQQAHNAGMLALIEYFTDYLHNYSPRKLFFLNGIDADYCATWCVDGMGGEHFVTDRSYAGEDPITHKHSDVMRSGNCWVQDYNAYRAALATGVRFVVPGADAPSDSPAGRLFALASGLSLQTLDEMDKPRVIMAPGAAELVPEGDSRDPLPGYYAEMQIDLGAPSSPSPVIPPPQQSLDHCQLSPELETVVPAVRTFDGGLVIVNFAELNYEEDYWEPGTFVTYQLPALPPGEEHYYRIKVDALGLVEGGRFWTERVEGDYIDVLDGHAEILVYEPIASPTVAEYAFQPLYRGGGLVSVLAVQARGWDKGPLVVQVDGTNILADNCLELLDDGLNFDVAADDGIFTSPTTIGAAALSPGIYELPIHVHGKVDLEHGVGDGYSTFSKLKVLVVEGIAAKYVDTHNDTGLNYSGQPYNSITLDYDLDGDLDMLVAIQENPPANTSYLYQQTGLSQNENVPEFLNRTAQAFGIDNRPLDGTRGISSADIDNDLDMDIHGYPDLFMAHDTSPRLYQNNGNGTFTDISDVNDIELLASHSWCGVWGDYDGDGFVDLYVGRWDVEAAPGDQALPDRLLRNELAGSGTFVDASDALGEEGRVPTLTCTAAWGDFNGDGKLDLFVGDRRPRLDVIDPVPPVPLWSRLYQNMGGGQLLSVYGWRVPERPQAWGVDGSAWADIDNDGDLDLVVATNTGARYLVNTSGFFAAAPSELVEPTRDVFPLDFDLSGTRDLLVLPTEPYRYPALLSNYVQPTGPVLTCVSDPVGLTNLAPAVGGFATDFNGDGDQEMFLGRMSQSEPFFFKNVRPDGTDYPPTHHYVAVKLKGGGAGNNVAAIGTKVSVTAGPLQQLQVVDGGSGRGGQASSILTFGLGPLTGPAAATITWPNGINQSLSLNLDQLTVVVDPARNPQIDDATISAIYQPYPGGWAVWVFTWKTTYPSVKALDKVEVKSTYDAPGAPPSPCQVGQQYTWLTEGVPGVSVQIIKEDELRYRHELRWDRSCVAGCTYWYRVYSSSHVAEVRGPSSGAYKKLSIGVCIDENPGEQ